MSLLRGPAADPHTGLSGGEPERETEQIVEYIPALAGATERPRGKLNWFDCERQEGGADDCESSRARPWKSAIKIPSGTNRITFKLVAPSVRVAGGGARPTETHSLLYP